MDYFFYGTLIDGDVRAAVLGRAVPGRDAVLPHFRRVRVRGASYPVVVAAVGTQTPGLLVRGLSAAEAGRLAAYEGTGYRRRRLPVRLPVRRADGGRTGAFVFVPRHPAMASAEPWSLDDWRRERKAAYLARLERTAAAASADRARP